MPCLPKQQMSRICWGSRRIFQIWQPKSQVCVPSREGGQCCCRDKEFSQTWTMIRNNIFHLPVFLRVVFRSISERSVGGKIQCFSQFDLRNIHVNQAPPPTCMSTTTLCQMGAVGNHSSGLPQAWLVLCPHLGSPRLCAGSLCCPAASAPPDTCAGAAGARSREPPVPGEPGQLKHPNTNPNPLCCRGDHGLQLSSQRATGTSSQRWTAVAGQTPGCSGAVSGHPLPMIPLGAGAPLPRDKG